MTKRKPKQTNPLAMPVVVLSAALAIGILSAALYHQLSQNKPAAAGADGNPHPCTKPHVAEPGEPCKPPLVLQFGQGVALCMCDAQTPGAVESM